MKKYHRKIIHILAETPFVLMGFFIDAGITRTTVLEISLAVLITFLTFEFIRLKHEPFNKKLLSRFSHLYKEHEQNAMISSIWEPIVMILLVLFFSKPVIVSTLCIACYSDVLASIFGSKFGKNKNAAGKTWIGTIAYGVSAFIFILFATAAVNFTINIIFALILALFSALFERNCTSKTNIFLDDNFIVPMAFAVIMELGIRYF